MGTAILGAIPADETTTGGGFVPDVAPFPSFYPILAQTPCAEAFFLCMVCAMSSGEDEPRAMCLPSSWQTSQYLAEQSKM